MVLNSFKPDFKGSGILFLKNAFLYVVVTAPLLSFCLMGAQWLHILLSMLALTLPFFLLVGLLVARFDGFSFDDERQRIVKLFGRYVPYQSIIRIDLNETGRLLQVRMKMGVLRWIPLAYALDGRDKPFLKAELLKRFSQSVLRERRFVDWKSIILIISIVSVMTIAFHLYLYRSNAAIKMVPQQAAWEAPKRLMKTFQPYSVGSFGIAVPKRFELIGKDETSLQFEDRTTREEIRCITRKHWDLPAPKALFTRSVSGIRNYYDVLNTAYSAQVGVVPLMVKVLLLEDLAQVRIREITLPYLRQNAAQQKSITDQREQGAFPGLRGFITQGRQKGKETAWIYLTDAVGEMELQIVLSGPIAMDEKSIQGIVTSVHKLPMQ
jgi:hypothetical protein